MAYNNYESQRKITSVPAVAKGEFSGQTYLARANMGYKIRTESGLDFTPNFGLAYSRNNIDEYTEKGAGNLNLKVKTKSSDKLDAKVGIESGMTYKAGTTLIRPELRAGLTYDIVGEEQASTSSFTGSGIEFDTKGAKVAKAGYMLGAGIDIASEENLSLSLDYSYKGKKNYDAHTGMLKLRYDFE